MAEESRVSVCVCGDLLNVCVCVCVCVCSGQCQSFNRSVHICAYVACSSWWNLYMWFAVKVTFGVKFREN